MQVIGTAGHVDHGKSSLVQALTGIDPDRLKEEKEREMTIDLGFAWMTFDDGREDIGIVDVPGHRDFIENMLAGIGGIHLALLVIAADEGVMPQTSEHLAILDILKIKSGVVALNKIDLIDDNDWLELVSLDVSEALSGTVLENAPIINVSAHTGEGIEELRQVLISELSSATEALNISRPRLPIDRIFSLPGFGTIVTGTLMEGRLAVGDNIQIQPQSLGGRIRGLQTHKTKKDIAEPGSRVAVNISGINKNEVRRGDVLSYPDTLSGTILCDVAYEHLNEAGSPLEHNQEVKFFTGAAEVIARTRVIGAKKILPGETGFLQLLLKEPAAFLRNDRFVLRRPSPAGLLGGGSILDPNPGRRYRRFSLNSQSHMETLARGQPEELIYQSLARWQPITKKLLFEKSSLEPAMSEMAFQKLLDKKKMVEVGTEFFTDDGYAQIWEKTLKIVKEYHQQYPLRNGIPREELRNRLRLMGSTFIELMMRLQEESRLSLSGSYIKLAEHNIRFTKEEETAIQEMVKRFNQSGVNSPSVKEAINIVGEEVFYALLDLGKLIQASADVVYTAEIFSDIENRIVDYLKSKGTINVAQVRDLLGTSRKYSIAILEYLDEKGLTLRIGDDRRLA